MRWGPSATDLRFRDASRWAHRYSPGFERVTFTDFPSPSPQSGSVTPELTFPFDVAAIDTGSNAIRFLAARFTAPGRWTELESQRVPVRLGHQVFLRGRMAPEAMDAAVRAFVQFRERIDALGIEHVRAVATSAVREARNGTLLTERIAREADIRLEIITGTEEARLVHAAVSWKIDLSGGQWILVDLGGGSVEVSLVDDAGMLWSESHTMGSVRLLEEVTEATHDPGRLRILLEEYVSVLRIPDPAQYWKPNGIIATGGNIEALARLASAPADDAGVAALPMEDLESLIQLLTRLSYRERMDRLGLREDRADVILPAALVYQRVARVAGADRILVPGVGVKEGVVLDMAEHLAAPDSAEARGASQMVQAATMLGRRFMFDEAHAVQVARLSLLLFDRLEKLHGLGVRDRLILHAAALLHDIGNFVSVKKHHKHSLYLISRSELPGLTSAENLLVANVARYHRKSHPQLHHDDYMQLPPADRVRVDQLASLLRLADALDRQHLQRVHDVEVTVRGLKLLLSIAGEGDLLLERWAVGQKKGLFEDTYGLTVEVAPAEVG
ncbi:MAG: Ppx/GppA family phosphatase [Gemmatimonadales bacterium]|nr:MAG: Ppx/GppA family phosphatase [Gemmatimonadales bacterium]